MTIPTKGETFTLLIEHIRKAQEQSAMMAHLCNAEGDDKGRLLAKGWLAISEGLKVMQKTIIEIAKGNLQ